MSSLILKQTCVCMCVSTLQSQIVLQGKVVIRSKWGATSAWSIYRLDLANDRIFSDKMVSNILVVSVYNNLLLTAPSANRITISWHVIKNACFLCLLTYLLYYIVMVILTLIQCSEDFRPPNYVCFKKCSLHLNGITFEDSAPTIYTHT